MNTLRLFDRRITYLVAAIALLIAFALPTLVAAAQVTTRSIELSSSSASASAVTYKVNFTPAANAGAFVVDFCSNSPLIGAACTSPDTDGFDATAAASTTSGFTDVSDLDANTVVVTGSMTASTPVSVELTGIDNPDTAGPLYARIVTYNNDTNADLYDSEDLGTGNVDDGSVAISITPTIGVSGAVLETMTFCVSKAAPTADCGGVTAPTLELGETSGGVTALSANALSTGSIYTQISTNAATGAIVSLKSNALSCGGLLRAGAPGACNILPADVGVGSGVGVVQGQANFGVTAAAAADTGTTPSGTFQTAAGSPYGPTNYRMNYVAGNASGVTSTYGDPFLDTDDAPVNNKNMQLTFGVSVSNDTPAGLYSADLSLIATGKF